MVEEVAAPTRRAFWTSSSLHIAAKATREQKVEINGNALAWTRYSNAATIFDCDKNARLKGSCFEFDGGHAKYYRRKPILVLCLDVDVSRCAQHTVISAHANGK